MDKVDEINSVSETKKSRQAKKTTKCRKVADGDQCSEITNIVQTSNEKDEGDDNVEHAENDIQLCCWHECHANLDGELYVLRDDHPYCIKCYENLFANACDQCKKIIGIESKDVSHKGKHWHKSCFLCSKCEKSLVENEFGSKEDKLYCGNCYDSQFSFKCDACNEIISFGKKKMEFKGRHWHADCFKCCACETPIGKRKFIPKEQEIYCSDCYEDKFGTKCTKCNTVITFGGVTYRNQPWHRRCFTCTNCKAYLSGRQFTSHEEKPYCAECYGKLLADTNTSIKPVTVGVFMKKELPERQIEKFLGQIFNREMRLNKKSVKVCENGAQPNKSR